MPAPATTAQRAGSAPSLAGAAEGVDGRGEAELGGAVDPPDLLRRRGRLDGVEALHLAGEADRQARRRRSR